MLDPTELGKRILTRRKEQGLTQEQLGGQLAVSPQAVSKWENGESMPDIAVLPALCRALDLPADTLLGIETESSVETSGAKLAQDIGRLMDNAQRNAALVQALSFLHPIRSRGHQWNAERNIAYEFAQGQLVELSFWSADGLVCFAHADVLSAAGSDDAVALLHTLTAPTSWKIAHLLLDGPQKADALAAVCNEGNPNTVQETLDTLMDAGILLQDKAGYSLEKDCALVLTGVLKALSLEVLKDGGRGTGLYHRS